MFSKLVILVACGVTTTALPCSYCGRVFHLSLSQDGPFFTFNACQRHCHYCLAGQRYLGCHWQPPMSDQDAKTLYQMSGIWAEEPPPVGHQGAGIRITRLSPHFHCPANSREFPCLFIRYHSFPLPQGLKGRTILVKVGGAGSLCPTVQKPRPCGKRLRVQAPSSPTV